MNVRKTVITISLLNFIYFIVEFSLGQFNHSLSMISDSIDFLEDTSINALIALSIGWSFYQRQRVGKFLAFIILIPGLTFIWNAINQLSDPKIPGGNEMSLVGLGALIVNLVCALMIARFKSKGGALVLAAYYSARNDAFSNLLIIFAGFVTIYFPSIWPDLLVGLIIFLLNADAAKEILKVSKGANNEIRS